MLICYMGASRQKDPCDSVHNALRSILFVRKCKCCSNDTQAQGRVDDIL